MKTSIKHTAFIVLFVAVSLSQAAVNLALVAESSSSFVSGDTRVEALNDGYLPTQSDDLSHGSYGNWPSMDTQWVEYRWSRPIVTERIEVYWWDDHAGVGLPGAARLLYWDGQDYVPVQSKADLGIAGDQFNALDFGKVTTTRLRLEIEGNHGASTGILEWKVVDAGSSSMFPPQVRADVDRVVVLGGKTYLHAVVKSLTDHVDVTWCKASGPGWVTFADAHQVDTTATFSQVGDYVLQCTANQGDLQDSDRLCVQVVEGPPAQNLHPVDTMPYQITSPLWSQRAKAMIVHWIPHCIDKINDPDLREGGMNNFIEAAKKLQGQPAGRHRGYVFSNAWIYNTLEAICVALMVDPQGDSEMIKAQALMRATLEDWIPKVLAAQEADGYIHTAYTLRDWPHWSVEHRSDHEGYVAGYFLEAAVSHYQLTGGHDLRLYNAAKKLADCWQAHIGPEPGKQEWYDGHQAMEMALVRFGRFVNTVEGQGHGDKYIRLAKFLLDCRKDGGEYDQSHVPVIEQVEAVGHSVRASYNYAAMSDVAMETHDPDYQSAVMSLCDNMINRKYYVTGGIGSGETSEGFGPDYSLRHEAYCESCASCGLIMFEHKLNLAYHDARYADLYETTLYNALLGGLDLEGKNFYYQNPLTAYGPRYPWHSVPCCVGNIPRVLLMLPTWTYVKGEDDLYVNLFVGSRITVPNIAGTDVEMVQDTDYPWHGDVAITVNPKTSKTFALHIRVPQRDISKLYRSEPKTDGILWIKLNGKRIQPEVVNGYAVIERPWQTGDKIELELPMVVQRIHAIDEVAATQDQVALRYGPLLYNVEAADQDLNNTLSPNDPLAATWQPELLQGIMAIQGQWSDGSDLIAIPNYARCNRIDPSNAPSMGGMGMGGRAGRLQSTVWIEEE